MTAALKAVSEPGDGVPSAEIYVVTPAVAKRWLTRNVRNRPIRQKIVDAYARDMKSGHWKITGEAIKFDTNGALADGQHRLNGVVKSGASVPMLIVRGVEPDAQAVMDSGIKRSQSDAFTLAGIANAPQLVAAARLALKCPELGYVATSEVIKSPTNTEVGAFIEDHPEIHRAAELGRHFYGSIEASPSVLTIAWMRLAPIDLAACTEFFSSVADMRTDGSGDPRLALARRLTMMRRDKVRRSPEMELSLIFRAWNKWRKGQSAASLPADAKIPDRLA